MSKRSDPVSDPNSTNLVNSGSGSTTMLLSYTLNGKQNPNSGSLTAGRVRSFSKFLPDQLSSLYSFSLAVSNPLSLASEGLTQKHMCRHTGGRRGLLVLSIGIVTYVCEFGAPFTYRISNAEAVEGSCKQ
jgi:hypothetical protein